MQSAITHNRYMIIHLIKSYTLYFFKVSSKISYFLEKLNERMETLRFPRESRHTDDPLFLVNVFLTGEDVSITYIETWFKFQLKQLFKLWKESTSSRHGERERERERETFHLSGWLVFNCGKSLIFSFHL